MGNFLKTSTKFKIFFWRCAVTIQKKIHNNKKLNSLDSLDNMGSQLYCFDLTVWCAPEDGEAVPKDKILAYCKKYAKEWAFQQEKCPETGTLHWQCRVSLGNKLTIGKMVKNFQENGLTGHVSVTSNPCKLPDKAWYCLKEDSRVDGPWTSVDAEPKYIPRQIREITKLYDWQQQIVDNAGVWDTRTINYVYEPQGNKGKSTLCGWIEAYEIGESIPPLNTFKDVMRMVCDLPVAKLYVVDVPRSLEQKNGGDFWAGIEDLKSGKAFDDRYKFRKIRFDCPNIWVFGNTLPDMRMLSAGRWKIWNIVDNKLVLMPDADPRVAGSKRAHDEIE